MGVQAVLLERAARSSALGEARTDGVSGAASSERRWTPAYGAPPQIVTNRYSILISRYASPIELAVNSTV